MTVESFFIGGQALRVSIFMVGLYYCWKHRALWSLPAAGHVGSIIVLVLILFSREWATLIGLPVTIVVVLSLTDYVRMRRLYDQQRSITEDMHAANELLLTSLKRSSRPAP